MDGASIIRRGSVSGSNAVSSPTSANQSTSFLGDFAFHLTEIQNDYLWFFEERARLEENFAAGLSQLIKRTKAIDTAEESYSYSYSPHSLPTLRSVWREMRENAEHEYESRSTFALAIRSEVIKPLSNLRETQARISRRVEGDLRDATTRYVDYSKKVNDLQKAYTKKTREWEDFAKHMTGQNPDYATANLPAHHRTPSGQQPGMPYQHQHQPEKKSSGGSEKEGAGPGIQEAKKQINSFLSNLQGLGEKVGQSGKEARDRGEIKAEREREKAETAVAKLVRLKREAEEADHAYRTGVFHLESLRMGVERVNAGGASSAAAFVQELLAMMQILLQKYCDSLHGTSAFGVALARRSEEALMRINAARDIAVSQAHAQAPEKLASVHYYNYFAGESRDLIFGVSLQDYAFQRGYGSSRQIPILMEKCIVAINQRGVDTEGLYRISPRQKIVEHLVRQIEKDEVLFQFHPQEEIYTIAAILKLYLRQLPEPLMRFPLADRVAMTKDRDIHVENQFLLIQTRIKRLPLVHQTTLHALLHHLSQVAMAENKMDAHNLAIIFGSLVFGDEDQKELNLLTMHSAKDTVFEDMLSYLPDIFQGQPPPALSSHNSKPAFSTKGSVHTKMTIAPETLASKPIPEVEPSSLPAPVALKPPSLPPRLPPTELIPAPTEPLFEAPPYYPEAQKEKLPKEKQADDVSEDTNKLAVPSTTLGTSSSTHVSSEALVDPEIVAAIPVRDKVNEGPKKVEEAVIEVPEVAKADDLAEEEMEVEQPKKIERKEFTGSGDEDKNMLQNM